MDVMCELDSNNKKLEENLIKSNNSDDSINNSSIQFDESSNSEGINISQNDEKRKSEFELLLEAENKSIVTNLEKFECVVCLDVIGPGMGIRLRDCLHEFCISCVTETIKQNFDVEIKCPFRDNSYSCPGILQHREIKHLLDETTFQQYSIFLQNMDTSIPDTINTQDQAISHRDEHALPDYYLLLELEDEYIVTNLHEFECIICYTMVKIGKGIRIRNCLHEFCLDCVKETIKANLEVEIKCPFRDAQYSCQGTLQQREIKFLLDENTFEKYLKMCLIYAEMQAAKELKFHCQKQECCGWWFHDGSLDQVICPVCDSVNCIYCVAIHPNMDCQTHKSLKNGDEDHHSYNTIKTEIAQGLTMNCPGCSILIRKVDGCDGIVCKYCQTDICWATKGRRWGPGGKNDTTGGCRCGVSNIRCHPNCRNCH